MPATAASLPSASTVSVTAPLVLFVPSNSRTFPLSRTVVIPEAVAVGLLPTETLMIAPLAVSSRAYGKLPDIDLTVTVPTGPESVPPEASSALTLACAVALRSLVAIARPMETVRAFAVALVRLPVWKLVPSKLWKA